MELIDTISNNNFHIVCYNLRIYIIIIHFHTRLHLVVQLAVLEFALRLHLVLIKYRDAQIVFKLNNIMVNT